MIDWATNLLNLKDKVNDRKYFAIKSKYIRIFSRVLMRHHEDRILTMYCIGHKYLSLLRGVTINYPSFWEIVERSQPLDELEMVRTMK